MASSSSATASNHTSDSGRRRSQQIFSLSRSPPRGHGPSSSADLRDPSTVTSRHMSSPPLSDTHRSLSASRPPSSSEAVSSMRGMRRLETRRAMEETHFLHSMTRAQNLNPPLDLRLLDYVGKFDENLMCPICRCPFVDPVVLTECDHYFCRDCIRQTWSAQYNPLGPRGDCPSCRTPAKLGPRSATSKILINILDDLLVKCPKHEQGCKVQVKRGEVQDHVNIYCGYLLVECPANDCDQPIRRKDLSKGCLHYGVSCIDCHHEMSRSQLETHWRASCPDRKVNCELCNTAVFSRELSEHSQNFCPAISVPCPGEALGCSAQSKRSQAEVHAKNCTFANLAPILEAQQQRMDEQETAQKLMSRKLEVLENGFSAVQNILYPRPEEAEAGNDIPRRPSSSSRRRLISFLSVSNDSLSNYNTQSRASPTPSTTAFTAAAGPSSSASNSRPQPLDFDDPSAFPPPSPDGPYTSPLHHLLSMHESLREETSRIASSLQDLDARHSMQNLNENLRTREEIAYLGAQVAGLGRQVHWLTSAQLQRAQQSGGGNGGVEAAVSAVGSAVRSVGRVVNGGGAVAGGSGGGSASASASAGAGAIAVGMRRGNSEEGRTKL